MLLVRCRHSTTIRLPLTRFALYYDLKTSFFFLLPCVPNILFSLVFYSLVQLDIFVSTQFSFVHSFVAKQHTQFFVPKLLFFCSYYFFFFFWGKEIARNLRNCLGIYIFSALAGIENEISVGRLKSSEKSTITIYGQF